MPPGKKGQASSLGQNKVHFHKYNLILLPPDTISSHSSEERGLLWKHRLSQARTSYSSHVRILVRIRKMWEKTPHMRIGNIFFGEFYQFNLSSCIRQQNSLTAQFVSFNLSNLANIFYPPNFYNN